MDVEKKRVLVTGGTGFIGTHLVRRLRSDGYDVIATGRRDSLDNIEKYGIIYYNAGVINHNAPSEQHWHVHVEMLKVILSKMSSHAQLVYTSSVYAVEDTSYGRSKLAGEKLILDDTRCRIVRPGPVYGPGNDRWFMLFKWMKRLGAFFPIQGNGKYQTYPTYVDDVIDALVENEQKLALVIGKSIDVNDLIYVIADTLKVSRPYIHMPAIIRRDFFTPKHTIFEGTSLAKTLLRDGMARTIEWYKSHGLL